MNKYLTIALSVTLALFMVGSVAVGSGGQPASKATAKVADMVLIPYSEEEDWTTILTNTLKTPNQKDLFIDVSLECGLYTDTIVRGKAGDPVSAEAEAAVTVQVLVDSVPAAPGEVVFCRRVQELTAILGGVLTCTDTDGDGHYDYNECSLTDEEIGLMLETTNANAFNFVIDDLTPGVHVIEVTARIDSTTEFEEPNFSAAAAAIGKGSMTVEEVRLIQNEDIELP
jgi:hypothetical protein